MSASYYFKCNKCQEIGGQYTRQAWGWGNFYVINSFKFLAFHTEHCGPQCICIVSENDVDANVFNAKNALDFLKKTREYFPAYQTKFDEKNLMEFDYNDLKEKWYQRELADLKLWSGSNSVDEEETK